MRIKKIQPSAASTNKELFEQKEEKKDSFDVWFSHAGANQETATGEDPGPQAKTSLEDMLVLAAETPQTVRRPYTGARRKNPYEGYKQSPDRSRDERQYAFDFIIVPSVQPSRFTDQKI